MHHHAGAALSPGQERPHFPGLDGRPEGRPESAGRASRNRRRGAPAPDGGTPAPASSDFSPPARRGPAPASEALVQQEDHVGRGPPTQEPLSHHPADHDDHADVDDIILVDDDHAVVDNIVVPAPTSPDADDDAGVPTLEEGDPAPLHHPAPLHAEHHHAEEHREEKNEAEIRSNASHDLASEHGAENPPSGEEHAEEVHLSFDIDYNNEDGAKNLDHSPRKKSGRKKSGPGEKKSQLHSGEEEEEADRRERHLTRTDKPQLTRSHSQLHIESEIHKVHPDEDAEKYYIVSMVGGGEEKLCGRGAENIVGDQTDEKAGGKLLGGIRTGREWLADLGGLELELWGVL